MSNLWEHKFSITRIPIKLINAIFVSQKGRDNPRFTYFENKIREIRKPGQRVPLIVGLYDAFELQNGYSDIVYYFYRGSYNNEAANDGNTCSACSTVIVDGFTAAISKAQVRHTEY